MQIEKKKILFIKRGNTTFEKNDIELLNHKYLVQVFEPKLFNFNKLFFSILKTDIIYFWFPNDYKFLIALIGKIFRKKVFVVGGGQMSTADNKKNREFAKVKYRFLHIPLGILTLKLADYIISVSEYEYNGLRRYVSTKKLNLIYNSINASTFNYNGLNKNKNIVITISALKNTHYHRKGLDTFKQASMLFPNLKFILIGKDCNDGTYEKIKENAPDNLILTGHISQKKLTEWLKKCSIYCQFSRQEGFGVSLAEAIACGCLPITSDYAAIPEVVGKNGFYIDRNINSNNLRDVFKKALNTDNKVRKQLSKRVIKLFNPLKRKKKLLECVDKLFE